MKIQELRSKTKEELHIVLSELEASLRKIRSDISEGKEKNVKKAKFMKKDIARMLTILTEASNA